MLRIGATFGSPSPFAAAAQLLTLALLFAHVGADAAIQEREVEATGNGATEHGAVSAALANAVAMVNGLSIESRQRMAAFQKAVQSDEGDSYVFKDASSVDIATLTSGTVSSYEVIHHNQTTGGHEARIRASVAVFQRGRSTDRKRVAVLPLRSRDNYAIGGVQLSSHAMADVVEQAIVNELVDSRRFTVLDRTYIEQVDIEKELLESGDVPVSELARLGQTLAADFVLVGTLENIAGSVNTRRMRTRDVEFRSLEIDVQLSYRVIDPATKQVKFSRTESRSFGDNELTPIATSPSATTTTIAIEVGKMIGTTVGATVTEAIYPISVTAVTSTGVVLGQGGESIVKGLVFEIYRLGDRMIDPYTKESIGRVEEWVGTVEVTRSTNKQSYAKLVKASEFDLQEHFGSGAFIARRSDDSAGASSVDRQLEETQRSRKRRDEEQEALW